MRALTVALTLSLFACRSAGAEPFKIIHTAELAALQKSEPKLVVLDANHEAFRKEHGVIPGARLLSNFKAYDLAELPVAKDTPLVFYCANRF